MKKRRLIKRWLVPPPELDPKVIGRRLRKARKGLHWTLTAASERTGINRSTLACYECGARVPVLRNLVRMCLAYRRTMDFVLLGRLARKPRASQQSSGRRVD